MSNSSLLTEISLGFEAFSTSSVSLSNEQIDRAIELTHPLKDESRKWFTYLNALALFGFENWLEERGDEFTVNRENCSIFNPEIANTIDAVCNLQVNQFKVCLVTVGSLLDEVVTVPQAVLDLPEYAAQFYVLVEVQEELETVAVSGFISYQNLIAAKINANLEPDEDWTYSIPLQWFEPETEELLLYLRCLEPAAIPLPEIPNRQTLLSAQTAQLQTILPQLQPQNQASNPQLWNLLNWEQATAILTHPSLLRWVYQIQNTTDLEGEIGQSELIETQKTYLKDLLKLISEPAINLGRWMRDELDNLANEFSWVLLPDVSLEMRGYPAMRNMRDTSEEMGIILQQLQQQGVEISPQAKVGYRDLQLAETSLRLYAVTGELESDTVREWKLLLILGTPSQTSLPHQVQLRVSDASTILDEQGLNPGDDYPYIFTEVVGSLEEKFIVTVSLGSELQETLPPFGFNPEQ
ncbi:DUF1822 family protein [Capilliphycus salinus ALCB114379]|uniref:DUF1822 family protein n=1 Tax=Capilliphycus salinus TaxID=2768948 RepID=UPI0039A448AD